MCEAHCEVRTHYRLVIFLERGWLNITVIWSTEKRKLWIFSKRSLNVATGRKSGAPRENQNFEVPRNVNYGDFLSAP